MEIMSEEEMGECLGTVSQNATFIWRGQKYRTVEVRFATKEEVALPSTTILKSEKVVLIPIDKGMRSVYA